MKSCIRNLKPGDEIWLERFGGGGIEHGVIISTSHNIHDEYKDITYHVAGTMGSILASDQYLETRLIRVVKTK